MSPTRWNAAFRAEGDARHPAALSARRHISRVFTTTPGASCPCTPIGRNATVNLSTISLTLVPNLTGKSPTEAATELRAAGLELGVIREVGPSGPMIVLE